MLTAIGRGAVQRLAARASTATATTTAASTASALRHTVAELANLRIAAAAVAPRAFSTSQWLGEAATAKKSTSSTAAKTTKKASTTTKKTAAAKKPKAKKKAVKPKPKKAKKVLTPEEQLALDIRNLKKVALLNEPKKLPETAWTVLVAQRVPDADSGGIGTRIKKVSQEYKDLSSFELQRLQDVGNKNKLANNAAYKAWVESHPANDIYAANRARGQLRRKLVKKSGTAYRFAIRDDRLPKKPQNSYTMYCAARWAKENYSGSVVEFSKEIASGWKSLSASERKTYEDLAAAELDRYYKEMKSVLGRDIGSPRTTSE